MRGSATFVVAALLALGAGFLGGEMWASTATGASDAELADLERRIDLLARTESKDAGPRTVPSPSRLAAAPDRRHAELDRRLRTVEETLDATRVALAASQPGARDAAGDVRQLQQLATPELLAEIDRRVQLALTDPARNPMTKRDAQSALRACDVLLGREVVDGSRATAFLSRGRAYDVLDDRAGAETAFHEAMKVAGPASPLGHAAASLLGWTAVRHKEPRAAATWFLSIAGQPDAAPRERALYRLLAANSLAGAGDDDRARELYRSVIDEFAGADDALARQHAESSRKGLERLDQRGEER